MADFARKEAETPYTACYATTGAVCRTSTNFQSILEFAVVSLLPIGLPQTSPDLRLGKNPLQPSNARSIVPVSCVFLDGQANGLPRRRRLASQALAARVRGILPFKEDERFEAHRAAVLGALARLPAYGLACGGDPQVAGRFYRRLLIAHGLPEVRV